MRDVGLLGGTFDPPHSAHVEMVRAVLAAKLVDEVVVVPAGDPWQKRPGTPAVDRLAMARLAFSAEPSCSVDSIEVDRPGATYAIDTVAALGSASRRIHYIVGSDTFALLSSWHRIGELVGLCAFLVVRRPGSPVNVPDIAGLQFGVVPMADLHDASSGLRAEMTRTGARPHEVQSQVWDYIVEHELYGVRGG